MNINREITFSVLMETDGSVKLGNDLLHNFADMLSIALAGKVKRCQLLPRQALVTVETGQLNENNQAFIKSLEQSGAISHYTIGEGGGHVH